MSNLELSKAVPNQTVPNQQPIREKIEEFFLKERTRQESSLNMIASSNVVPKYVLEALGSNFTNVVAEGYRNNRYHTGTENYDDLEILGEELAQKAFGGYHVNLKPHSGTQAVQAAFLAMKAEGRSCVLSMGLKDGGHITHGKITHFNKEIGFKFVHYGVSPDWSIDYEQVQQLAKQEGADIIVVGASAYPKKIEWSCFREIADKVGARIIADISHYAGLIAGGAYPNPGANADIIVMSTNKTLPGPKGGIIFLGKESDEKLKTTVKRAVNIGLQSEDISNGVVGKVAVLAIAQHRRFPEYARATVANARLLCNYLHNSGIPVVGYDTKTQGTDSHMVLINVHAYNPLLNGNIVAEALAKAGIYANRNPIPQDPLSSNETSGVRFGTAAISLLGMGESEVRQVGTIIAEVIASLRVEKGKVLYNNTILQTARSDIAKLRQKFCETIFDK
jgi:glycine hydroxymethyltransferase